MKLCIINALKKEKSVSLQAAAVVVVVAVRMMTLAWT
jgi:hypothetical protein